MPTATHEEHDFEIPVRGSAAIFSRPTEAELLRGPLGVDGRTRVEPDPEELPIVLLPDDFDIESLVTYEQIPEPGAVASATTPARERELPASPPSPQEERLLDQLAAEIDEEIEDELAHGEKTRASELSLPRVCRWIVASMVPALGVLLVIGWPYYALPVAERPVHFLHSTLRPSSAIGLSLGTMGTALMLASLLYLVRKRIRIGNRGGSVRSWMGFHVLMGLMGPALVVFHSNFVPTSAIGALALGSMLVVVTSGVMGRYLLAFVPQAVGGSEVDLDELRRRLVVYRRKLAHLGIDPHLLGLEPSERRRLPFQGLIALAYGDREARQEFQRLEEAVKSRAGLGIQTRTILVLARRLMQERQWYVRYRELRRLVGAWRHLHRWLAIVLFGAVALHIAVALRFGGLLPSGGLSSLWTGGGH